MQLTKHFTLEEFLKSPIADEKGFTEQYNPSDEVIANLKNLCENVLEPLRAAIGKPITVTSGYRCERVNLEIGGVQNSQHLTGQAADTHVEEMSIEAWFRFIKTSGVPYDQLIQEFDSWSHVSHNPAGVQREQALRYTNVNGQVAVTDG